MREGMVRRRGLMSGGERLLVDLPETPTAGRTLAASPRTRCSGKANLMNELLAAARTTKTPRRAWTSGFTTVLEGAKTRTGAARHRGAI